jgi:hypothetical protein
MRPSVIPGLGERLFGLPRPGIDDVDPGQELGLGAGERRFAEPLAEVGVGLEDPYRLVVLEHRGARGYSRRAKATPRPRSAPAVFSSRARRQYTI